MSGPEVVVVETGTANLASVVGGLARAGATPRRAKGPDDVRSAECVVLPGVGSFGASYTHLSQAGMVEPLLERFREDRATLAICVGFQLLCDSSEESSGIRGFGIIPQPVRRLPPSVRVPQFGWNRVVPAEEKAVLERGYAYFANSYYLAETPDDWKVSHTYHGVRMVASVERGLVFGCQFHPELSGNWGVDLLRRWLGKSTGRVAPPSKYDAITRPLSRRPPAAAGLASRVIPCLDVRDGRVVKGVKFAGLRDAGSPSELAAMYEEHGADEVVLLDVSATPEGRGTQVDTVKSVRAVLSIPLTVGGGVRSVEDAGRLLDAGADKVAVNTAAVQEPRILTEIAERFGNQCSILALDAARRTPTAEQPGGMSNSNRSPLATDWEVVVHSGKKRTGIDAVEWAKTAVEHGAGEILLTSWDRDGTRSGYDLDLLRAISQAVHVPVIASGGASSPEHLVEALQAGADAVLAASIFHDGDYTVTQIKLALMAKGVDIRI